MAPYVPKHVPKYVNPAQRAQERGSRLRMLLWVAFALPVTFMFLVYGYSDQAPAFLRSAIVSVDRALGYPIMALLSTIRP